MGKAKEGRSQRTRPDRLVIAPTSSKYDFHFLLKIYLEFRIYDYQKGTRCEASPFYYIPGYE